MEISKRDYFAAQALTGLLARLGWPIQSSDIHAKIATEAFLYADQMLKLSKTLLDPIEIDPDAMGHGDEQLPLKPHTDTKPAHPARPH